VALGRAAEGCRVALVARTEATLEQTAGEIGAVGGEVFTLRADVTEGGELAHSVREAARRWGRLDVLVNNVGGSRGGAFVDTTDADWAAAVGVNLLPAVRAGRLAVPHLREQGGGSRVMVASAWGREA